MATNKLTGRDLLITRIEKRIKSRKKNIANAKEIYLKVIGKLNENLALDVTLLNSLKHGNKK